jgi:hypothetical protein
MEMRGEVFPAASPSFSPSSSRCVCIHDGTVAQLDEPFLEDIRFGSVRRNNEPCGGTEFRAHLSRNTMTSLVIQ